MQLEEFFEALSFICMNVLPLLGVILLVYLIIMVRNLIVCLKSAAKTLDEANNQLRKLDVPLNTVSEISKSVDYVHDLTKESLKSISLSLFQALSALKEWLMNFIHKEQEAQSDDSVIPEEQPVVSSQETEPQQNSKGEKDGE